MTTPVQIPADVDREDRLLGDLTARQLIILTTTALAVYLVWTVTGPAALMVFAVSAAPLGLVGLVLAFGRRDGVRRSAVVGRADPAPPHPPRPHRPADVDTAEVADPDPRRAAVARRRGRARTASAGRLVLPRIPASRVLAAGPDLGVVDLGRDGWAVVCAVSPVNFTLRSGPERDVLLAGFARWLHSLATPVQILTRTHPVDLTATITGLRCAAARLPHPALATAASAHADHLHELGAAAELLHREFLIVFRTPTPIAAARARRRPTATSAGTTSAATAVGETASDRATRSAITQLRRRADEAVGLLGGIGLRVTPLDPAAATRVLQSALRPEHGAASGARPAAPGLAMRGPSRPGSPPRAAGAQPHAAHRSSAAGGPPSARNVHRGGTRLHSVGVGVGVDDQPTIELDPTAAATAVPSAVATCAPTADRARSRSSAGSAINTDLLRAAGGGRTHSAALGGMVEAALDRAAGRDDDEIERANGTGAGPAAHDVPDRSEASAIAATITAALTPPGPTEDAAPVSDRDGDGDGGVAVAEDMTLDDDEQDARALTPGRWIASRCRKSPRHVTGRSAAAAQPAPGRRQQPRRVARRPPAAAGPGPAEVRPRARPGAGRERPHAQHAAHRHDPTRHDQATQAPVDQDRAWAGQRAGRAGAGSIPSRCC